MSAPPIVPEGCFPLSATRITIRFADVDMMQVVHHASYLHWFELIRFNALEQVFGLSYEDLKAAGLALPLTSCAIDFRRSVRFEDQVTGYALLELHKKAAFTVHYRIYRDRPEAGRDRPAAAPELCVSGSTTHCFLDRENRLLLWTPPLVRDAFAGAVERWPGWVLMPAPTPKAEVTP